jgi:hypothetical protein
MLKRQANATVVMAAVTDVDVERHQIVLDRGEFENYAGAAAASGAVDV